MIAWPASGGSCSSTDSKLLSEKYIKSGKNLSKLNRARYQLGCFIPALSFIHICFTSGFADRGSKSCVKIPCIFYFLRQKIFGVLTAWKGEKTPNFRDFFKEIHGTPSEKLSFCLSASIEALMNGGNKQYGWFIALFFTQYFLRSRIAAFFFWTTKINWLGQWFSPPNKNQAFHLPFHFLASIIC